MKKVLRIPIARLGAWHHPQYGVVKFTKDDFNSIVENFKTNVRGYEPPLRYGHNEKGPGIHDGERALGHMVDAYQSNEILWGVFEPNDSSVVEEIEKGQYRYATAEIIRNAVDKFSGKKLGPFLKSHALTNTPFIPNLPRNIVESSDSLAEVLSDGGEVSYVLSDLSETGNLSMMTCECCGQPCDSCDEQGYCETCQKSEYSMEESSEENKEELEVQDSQISTGLLRKLSDFMRGISQEVGTLEKEIYNALDQAKPEKAEDQEESSLMQKLAQRIENLISKLDRLMSGEDKAETYSDSENPPAEQAASVAEVAEVAPETAAQTEEMAEVQEVVQLKTQEEGEQEPDAASTTEEDHQVKEELEKLQAEMERLAAEKAELETAKAAAEEAAKAAIAELEAKHAEAAAAEAARKEEEFAHMLSDRVTDLVAKGVAPVKANKAANLVRSLKSSVTAVVLSEGAEPVNLVDAVFELLSDVQDVSFEQDGVAGLPGDAVEENPYKAQIERLRAKRAGQ